ncbi:MAG: DUF4438 domain-containing protein [Deltaproteobacteria bacterium]|nr:DUF4438 domain-containing protein [Deltaproteobacteria bacterium]
MLKTNSDRLVQFALQGSIIPPVAFGWEVTRRGEGLMLPSVGGITYNVKIGDSVFGFEADHVEPGLSLIAGGYNDRRTANPNLGFNIYTCIGNVARVVSGPAKGKKGTVVGHHGGVEHVLADFPDDVLEKLTYDDKILIRGVGQGLKLVDYPDITITGLDPELLKKIPIKTKSKSISVPVVATVPAELMGSGLGHNDSFKGDYDIQTSDPSVLKKYRLEGLRFGDLVAIIDHESTFGWSYKKGAVSIAVVVHGNSFLAGHGPGVQTIFTSRDGLIQPIPDKKANIGNYLGIGRFKRKSK